MKRRLVTALALLALLAAGVWFAMREADLPAIQPQTWLPADAEVLAWTEPLGPATDQLAALATRVPGLRGVLDAVTMTVGVDLRNVDAVDRLGLQRDAGLAGALWHRAAWAVVPVRGPRGVDYVLEQLRRRGYGIGAEQTQGSARDWAVTGREGQGERLHVWDLGPAALVRLPLDPTPTETPAQALTAWQSAKRVAPQTLSGKSGSAHVLWNWADPQVAQAARTRMHQWIGPADLLLGGAIDRLDGAQADVTLADGGAALDLQLHTTDKKLSDIAQYHVAFLPEAAAMDVGDLLPDETPLLVRARANPALWSAVPELVRTALLPSTALQALHPALASVDATQILPMLDGQLAAGLLAVADAVPLDPNLWPTLWWRTALRPFVIAGLRSEGQAAETMAKIRAALDASADKPVATQVGAWTGFLMPGPDAPWLLLRKGPAIAFVSGQGSADDLRRVADGKYETLAKVAQEDQERQLVAGQRHWFGAVLHTPRLVRSLRRRGVPDYATQLVGAVQTVTLAVTLEPSGLRVRLALRPEEAEAVPADVQVRGAGGAQ